ncbi:MAG: hypothetical protein ACE15B_21785 [Bryobacteraceae bacterium]
MLLVLSLYLYSPWHIHTPYKACSFSNLEHGGAVESCAQPILARPALLLWRTPEEVPARLLASALLPSFGRAPPA